MNCSTSFEDYLVSCPDGIILNILFDALPYTVYLWVITDKFGNKNQGELTQSEEGGYLIPTADLPDGLLTQYSGQFILEIMQEGACGTIPFVAANSYKEIVFSVQPGNFIKANLGCPL